jgi:hypothetical protein
MLPRRRRRRLPYANICETCGIFVTGPEFRDALEVQRTDTRSRSPRTQLVRRRRRHHRSVDALTDRFHRLDR